MQGRTVPGTAFCSYGFRPFFLSAALFAGMAVPAWIMVLIASGSAGLVGTARDWHVHEMIFGFLPAVITGVALTAIPIGQTVRHQGARVNAACGSGPYGWRAGWSWPGWGFHPSSLRWWRRLFLFVGPSAGLSESVVLGIATACWSGAYLFFCSLWSLPSQRQS